jgi:hypothetical protein
MPKGWRMELSPNSKHIIVGFSSGRRSFLNTSLGMRLTLAQRSHKAFSNLKEPMEHGIVGRLGSPCFSSPFAIAVLHCLDILTWSTPECCYLILVCKYILEVARVRRTWRASNSSMLMLNLCTTSTNFSEWLSSLPQK